MNVLITGVSGQIGRYLAEHLHTRGDVVYGLVQPHAGVHRGLSEADYVHQVLPFVHTVSGDLLDYGSLLNAVTSARPDEIYLLGALSQPGLTDDMKVLGLDINFMSLTRLLDLLDSSAVNRMEIRPSIVHASSDAIFGENAPAPQSAETPIRPETWYAMSKAAAHMAIQVARRKGHRASNAILFNAISPRQTTGAAAMICADVASVAAMYSPAIQASKDMSETAPKIGVHNGHVRRDFSFAGDVAAALICLARAETPQDVTIGSGVSRTLLELAETAMRAAGLPGGLLVETEPDEVAAHPRCDTTAIELLGWRPTMSFDELIASMVAESREGRSVHDC